MPLVTVVMPAFQAAGTIRRAVASIRRQTFRDWRLIIVDDGSTDATASVAAAASESDPRVILVSLSLNIGAAAAMNTAWRQSDSEYVAILDSDDAALPGRIKTQVSWLSEHPHVSVLGSAAHFVDRSGRFLRTVTMRTEHEILKSRRWLESPFIHPTVMMRRRFLEECNGYESGLRLGEDYDLWMRGFARDNVIYANLAEPLIFYGTIPIQKWTMAAAGVRVRVKAGRRERRLLTGLAGATYLIGSSFVEHTGFFAWRDRMRASGPPPGLLDSISHFQNGPH